ncbi:MAG: AAA family ATPase [Bacteriovoracaceae bacterium]|nr:AAA family ATPase [Bacteriovoracaceae bacterium]
MYITKLVIRNFRNFKNSSFVFKKGINTLIGENGSGKTNVFQAMRLLLDDTIPNRNRKLSVGDFSRAISDWKGHWIVIQSFFDEIGDSESEKLMAYATSKLEDPEKGSYTYLFRPKLEFRKALYELSNESENEKIVELLSSLSIDDYEFKCICRASVDLSDDENYKKYVGDFESLKFPDPDDKLYDELWGNTNAKFVIFDQISCTFIKALRDAVKELRYSKYSPLKKLLEGLESEVSDADLEAISNNVVELNESITSLETIKEVKREIESTILSSVGHSYSPSIDVKSEVPDELNSLFQSLALWVGDPNDDHKGYLDDLSLGGANLVYLSIKLLEYEQQKRKDKITHFLLIEEPEAHIHTHIQKTLFGKLKSDNTQVFVSTHSTHISSVSRISSVNILSSAKNTSEIYFPSTGLTKPVITKVERYLDAVRTNLLFAKGVILVEGDAEHILIPSMIKKCLGITLDEIGISVINVGSTGFDNIAVLFSSERIKKRCAIITDLDTSILDLDTPPDPKDTNEVKFYNRQKKSQEKGVARIKALDENFKSNEFVNYFLAHHTFEVELLFHENNNEAFLKIAKDTYSSKLEQINNELEDSEVSVYGRRSLRMANKLGKGWFAVELANTINNKFLIPGYIIEAIAFSAGNKFNEKLLKEMILFSLNHHEETDEILELKELVGKNEIKNVITKYKEVFESDDNLSKLLSFIA